MVPAPIVPPEDDEAVRRARRGRNWAMLIILLALSGLFYAIALVKLARPTAGG